MLAGQPDDGPPPTGRLALWALPKVGIPELFVLFDAVDDGTAAACSTRSRWPPGPAARPSARCSTSPPKPRSGRPIQRGARPGSHAPASLSGARRPAGSSTRKCGGSAAIGPTPVPGRSQRSGLLDAIERVGEGALDRYTRDERERLGATGEARQVLKDLRHLSSRVVGLAYDRTGALVGLVPALPRAGHGHHRLRRSRPRATRSRLRRRPARSRDSNAPAHRRARPAG